MNKSEEYAFSLARRSSLTLWSYATPLNGRTRKELCDVLIMFPPHLAILSVKEIYIGGTSQPEVVRWTRRAIRESAKQIYGAERWLRSATHIVRSDGTVGLPLPQPDEISVHKIAVALGSRGKAPVPSGDFGKGLVHVFDDRAFEIILGELDTPADLFPYLAQKEALAASCANILLEGGEEDMFAWYLANDRSFPTAATGIVWMASGLWDDFSAKPGYAAKRGANKAGLTWDSLIERVAHHALTDTLEFGGTLTETELALTQMASETRDQRRVLGQAFEDFLMQSATSIRSRLVASEVRNHLRLLGNPARY